MYEEDDKDKSIRAKKSGFKRQSTLLNSLKEKYNPDEPVGNPPKNLTFDFLKDLIIEEEKNNREKANMSR